MAGICCPQAVAAAYEKCSTLRQENASDRSGLLRRIEPYGSSVLRYGFINGVDVQQRDWDSGNHGSATVGSDFGSWIGRDDLC